VQLKASLRGHDYATQVQMLAPMGGQGDGPPSVRQAADHGTSGPSGKLPHGDTIQQSFGGYDISNVQAHLGGPAAAANRAMGADAYATGNHVVFGEGGNDLHTAAHEAAHVVQQQRGVALSGGVGQTGDAYEQNADAVADRVVAGKSAEDLLGQTGGGGGGSSQDAAVQKKDDPDADLAHDIEPEKEAADPELDAFLKAGGFGPFDLKAPTGLGGFSAEYDVASGELRIGIQGSIDFRDGLEDVGGGVVVANEPDLQGAADAANNLIDQADVDAFLVDFRWAGADTGAWVTKMATNVEAAWGGQFGFYVDRPGWEDVAAKVKVTTDIRADLSRADDHVAISVYKVPDSGSWDLGAYVASSDTAYDNNVTLSSRDNQTGEERAEGGDSGLLNWQIGPFEVGSSLPDAAIVLQVMRFGADFQDANDDLSNPVQVTGRASADGSKAANDKLAAERADEVVSLMNDEGIKNTRITLESVGAEGATEDAHWRRVDLKVCDGRTQDVAVHEFGHVLGLDDYYDNAADGRGGNIGGTGQVAGTLNRHDQLAKDIGVSGGAVHENNDGIMSLGTNVKPADYATIGWALQTVTCLPQWRVRA